MMEAKPYGVHVVVDPGYGERLRNLPPGEPVWVVDSEVNVSVVTSMVYVRRDEGAITHFRFDADKTPEDWLIEIVWTIDLHHGHHAHDPPYSWLNVIGTPWSERIQEALDELGLFEHEATAEGFIARRNLMEWQPPP